MTWITDSRGTRWVDTPVKKRRARPRALRFGNLEPGAILIHRTKSTTVRFDQYERLQAKGRDLPFANDDAVEVRETHRYVSVALVTDRWFDPVLGEDDPLRGEMAAVLPITSHGVRMGKRSHTLRGLASQGYDWTTPDQAERIRAWCAAREALIAEWQAGLLTDAEARLRNVSLDALLRQIGVEA